MLDEKKEKYEFDKWMIRCRELVPRRLDVEALGVLLVYMVTSCPGGLSSSLKLLKSCGWATEMEQMGDVLGRPPRDVLPLPMTCDLAVEAAEAVKGMRALLKLDAEAEVTYDKKGAPGKRRGRLYRALGSQCWLFLQVLLLNHLYVGDVRASWLTSQQRGPLSLGQRDVLQRLRDLCVLFCDRVDDVIP